MIAVFFAFCSISVPWRRADELFSSQMSVLEKKLSFRRATGVRDTPVWHRDFSRFKVRFAENNSFVFAFCSVFSVFSLLDVRTHRQNND